MKNFVVAVLFFFSLNAMAARFEVIRESALTNEALAHVAQIWNAGPANHTDVSTQATQIISKKPSEPYANTLMQMLWGTYTYQVSAEPASFSRKVLKKEIDFLFDAATWLQSEASLEQIKKYKKDLLTALLKLSSSQGVEIYVGVIEGDFSASFVHISLVDIPNGQTLSLIGGYSE